MIAEKLFIRTSVLLLLLTSGAKLLSATSSGHIVEYPDPLLGLSNRQNKILIRHSLAHLEGCTVQ